MLVGLCHVEERSETVSSRYASRVIISGQSPTQPQYPRAERRPKEFFRRVSLRSSTVQCRGYEEERKWVVGFSSLVPLDRRVRVGETNSGNSCYSRSGHIRDVASRSIDRRNPRMDDVRPVEFPHAEKKGEFLRREISPVRRRSEERREENRFAAGLSFRAIRPRRIASFEDSDIDTLLVVGLPSLPPAPLSRPPSRLRRALLPSSLPRVLSIRRVDPSGRSSRKSNRARSRVVSSDGRAAKEFARRKSDVKIFHTTHIPKEIFLCSNESIRSGTRPRFLSSVPAFFRFATRTHDLRRRREATVLEGASVVARYPTSSAYSSARRDLQGSEKLSNEKFKRRARREISSIGRTACPESDDNRGRASAAERGRTSRRSWR